MSKKRGLSLEEKREHILQIFYESQDFFLEAFPELRELEKLGPRKGVVSQTVKDVVQSLVDDDLVLKDKIGSSIPLGEGDHTVICVVYPKNEEEWYADCVIENNELRNTRYKLEADVKASKKRLAELVELRENLKKGREDSDERNNALEELKNVEQQHNVLKDEMDLYADNDPAILDAMKSATEIAISATNRWTDNIFTVQHWCSQNFPQAREQLEHLYGEVGITEDLDYIEPSKV